MGLVLRLTKVIIEGDPLSVITKYALATECVKKGEGFYLIGSAPESAATTFSDDWLREPD
ncbi:hypothetical protein Goshw_022440 [Gossypium schwendimanii]|uniref:Uncharacterized protein n=1 Tax=Gossypium schwendimanii TaxID=34291 RepID=A0A7J9LBS5_GOSSC|nr:hypothetical protein [Gossypium schwendimanii]